MGCPFFMPEKREAFHPLGYIAYRDRLGIITRITNT